MSDVPVPPSADSSAAVATRRRWLRRAGEAIVLLLLILGVRAWQQSGIASGPAPALAGEQIDGKPITLAAFAGRPVLVHFWATWCAICSAEQGNVEALARDAAVITVAMQSGNRETVIQHLHQQALSFPVINDPEAAIAAQWGVRAVPASFFVDGAGQIRFVEVGYTTSMGLRLRLWLAGLY